MAKTLRKKNFKIQMLAGNNLKSFPNANFQKTVTLVGAWACPVGALACPGTEGCLGTYVG